MTAVVAIVVIAGSIMAFQGPGGALLEAEQVQLYEGRAYAVGITYPDGDELKLADTGPQSGAEYDENRQLTLAAIPNSEGEDIIIDVEGAQALANAPTHPYTLAANDRANSEAYVGNVTLFPHSATPIRLAGVLVGARAACTDNANDNTSGTAITAIQIGDERIGIGLNTLSVIDNPENDAVLIFNERRTLADGTKMVNGVRVKSPAGEIIIGHVEANCTEAA